MKFKSGDSNKNRLLEVNTLEGSKHTGDIHSFKTLLQKLKTYWNEVQLIFPSLASAVVNILPFLFYPFYSGAPSLPSPSPCRILKQIPSIISQIPLSKT